MSRPVLASALVAVALLTPGAFTAPAKTPTLLEVIEKRHTFDAIEDVTLRLDALLAHLGEKLGIAIDVDSEAFEREGVAVADFEIASKRIPAYKNVTLDYYLRKLLSRLPSESGATFWVRRDRLEITTGRTVANKVWGPEYRGPMYPLVNVVLDKQELSTAVQELAARHELSAVIDPRVGDKAKASVSARLLNTPLDTALRLLTDQAELEVFALDNVFYVTTPERATVWKARLQKDRESSEDPNQTPTGRRVGTGPLSLTPPGGAPGLQ